MISYPLLLLVAAIFLLAVMWLTQRSSGSGPSPEDPERLATLLVQEIALYNQELVEKGRREKAIYAHLREDIERSRAMYEKRVGDQAGSHFDDALVRILARGDRSALGA